MELFYIKNMYQSELKRHFILFNYLKISIEHKYYNSIMKYCNF